MRTLIASSSFKRSFKRIVRRRPELFARIEDVLNLLVEEPFHPMLHTHKLKGDLAGRMACTVDYEYRIVFEFVSDPETGDEAILLDAVGTHHEVY